MTRHRWMSVPVCLRLIGTGLVLGLAGCNTAAPPAAPLEKADFSAYAPIALNVGQIKVVDNSRRGANAADGSIPVPPAEGIKRWVQARLQARGGDGSVTVIIKEAGIVRSSLAKTDGIKGVFTNDQAERYDARAVVDIVAEKPSLDGLRGSTSANASRFVTLPENVSLQGRENAVQNLSTKLVEDLNARLDGGIRRDLARLVAR